MYFKILRALPEEGQLWSFDDPERPYRPKNGSDAELNKYLVHALSFDYAYERGKVQYREEGLNEPPFGARIYESWNAVWEVIKDLLPSVLEELRVYLVHPQQIFEDKEGKGVITDQVRLFGYYTINYHHR